MKKILVVMLLAVLGLSLAYANEAFGLRAGLNLTNRTYSGSNDIDTDNRIGFHAGVVAQYPIGKYLVLQPELMYTQKGWSWTVDIPIVDDIVTTYKLDSVELPILLKMNLDFGSVAIQPFVAPQLSYCVIAERHVNDNVFKIMDDINPFQYGAQFGLDLQLNKSMLIGGRYQMGFSDIFDDDNDNVSYTHNGILISFGYLF